MQRSLGNRIKESFKVFTSYTESDIAAIDKKCLSLLSHCSNNAPGPLGSGGEI